MNTAKDQFVKRGYEKTLIENQMGKVAKLDRSVLLAEQNKTKKVSCLPLLVTSNRTLPNIKNRLQKHPASVLNSSNIRGHISTISNTGIS